MYVAGMGRSIAASLAVVAALWVSAPSRGDACGNAVLATEKIVAAVKDAEKMLDDGNPAEGRRLIVEALGDADEIEPDTALNRGLTDRARRIQALATIRLDADGARGEYRKARFAIAVGTLKMLSKADPDNVAKQTDLAEALVKTWPVEARKRLTSLAERDLLTTPYAYAALARLRAEGGDTRGRDEALARCKLMAKVETICKLEQPRQKS